MTPAPDRTRIKAIRDFLYSVYLIAQISFRAAPWMTAGIVLIRILQSFGTVATVYILKLIVDRLGEVFTGQHTLIFEQDILPLVLLWGIITFMMKALADFNLYLNGDLGRTLQVYSSKLVYGHLLNLKGLENFESSEFHNTLDQATRHLQMMPPRFINNVSGLLLSFITMANFIGILVLFNPLLAIILIVATIPQFLVKLHFRRKYFDASKRVSIRERQAWYFGGVLSQTNFARELRLFNLGEYFLSKYEEAITASHTELHNAQRDELGANLGLNVITALMSTGMYLVIITAAFFRQITLGDVTLYIQAVNSIQDHLIAVSSYIVGLNEQTLFFSHYRDLTGMQSDLQQFEPVYDAPPLTDKIELRGVSFRYDSDGAFVLKDINLIIHKGESLAIVGLNGAGKTTIVKLLARFYDPTAGEILWDGVDIRHFDVDSLRLRVGAVLQDFIKYDLTARENIGLGDLRYINDLSRIQHVANQVGVHPYLASLPDQYETVLSRWLVEKDEKGTDLSGGQWQKIAISRTYLRNVDVLLMDEPTAALDAEAEHDIYQHFADIAQNRATILISHRFSTVRMADKIAVLEDGRIAEYGTHQSLLAQQGTYAHLYKLQAEQYM